MPMGPGTYGSKKGRPPKKKGYQVGGKVKGYQKGGLISWMFGGKRYSGRLIPSMETATHRFARTHNGKIKRLPKRGAKK
tara:strand:- start:443 stop:679 length:237 start_codon:yes stop_codon:yes gene_type:complete